MNLEEYIRDVPDFPKKGIVFKDITPLLASPEAFGATIGQLADRYRDQGLAKIVGIEARGFIFGAALARTLNLPFIPARKPGKLPYETISESYTLEYGEAALELHVDAIESGDKVLLIDDLLATGGTLAAAVALVEKLGGEVAEIATIIELTFLNGLEKLSGKPFYSMIQY